MKRCPSCSFMNGSDAGFCIQCGAVLGHVTADDTVGPAFEARPGYLAPGTVVDGKYRIERVLGEGGMGVVYLAHDVHTDMQVVVKAIRAEFAHNAEFRARTLAEGRALARIDHPNVVRLNAVVVEPTTLYLVMQFIDGEPLDALIERHVATHMRVPIALALSIFRMILHGVGAAHAEGLIHRDLKPANILIRKKDGVAKVTDFGIAKGEEDAKAGRGVTKGIIGSVAYMAPEQVRGRRDLDKRVDIYALGILFFELLIGRTPFEAPSDFEVMRMHAETPIPSATALRSDVPAALDAVIRRACAKERDERFANTDAFLAALDAPLEARHVPPTAQQMRTELGSGTPPGAIATAMATEPAWRAPAPGPAHGAGFGASTPHTEPGERGGTAEGSALPSAPAPPLRRSSPLRAVGIASALAVIAGGAGVYFFSMSDRAEPANRVDVGARPGPGVGGAAKGAATGVATPSATGVTPGGTATAPGSLGSTASTAAPHATSPAVDAEARISPLAALAGAWRSTSNRDYLAVLAGDRLEFRIEQASQHPRQGYENGDVRFELAAIADKHDQFAVEDHIRPTPPSGVEYDPRTSRESCVATWTSVKGRKLVAKIDAKGDLVVELVQIRTGVDKFKIDGRRVVSCSDLAAAPAEPIESRLSRAR